MKIIYNYVYICIIIFCIFIGTVHDIDACSEIFLHTNDSLMVSARNFDFMHSNSIVRFSPAYEKKHAQYAPDSCVALEWISQYASIYFAVLLPKEQKVQDSYYAAGVDGINEKNLKIGTYFMADSQFPEPQNTCLDITSLMQYLLDTCNSVQMALQVLIEDSFTVIATPTTGLTIKLHLFLEDASGDVAIVEYINGKLCITKQPEISVLTNHPYRESCTYLQNYTGFGGDLPIPGANESLDRFVRGAFYAKHAFPPASKRQAINYGFATIQILSVSPRFAHGCTQYTVVTDIIDKQIFFRTLNNPRIVSIDLQNIIDHATEPKTISLQQTNMDGNISTLFYASF